jgi:hypothetical protein
MDQHLSGGRLDEPVDVPDEGGFAGPRQPHDDLDAARRHRDVDVLQGEDMVVLAEQLGLAEPLLHQIDGFHPIAAEDLVQIPDLDAVFGPAMLNHGRPLGVSGACVRKPG